MWLSSGVQSGRRLEETETEKTKETCHIPSAPPTRGGPTHTRWPHPHTVAPPTRGGPAHAWWPRPPTLTLTPPHHRQVSVLGLGHDELRPRREVDDPFFPLADCKLDAAEEEERRRQRGGGGG